MLADGGRPHLLRCALSRSGEQVPMPRPAASSHIYTLHLMHRSAENSKAALFSPIQLCGSATEHTNTHTRAQKQGCLSSEGHDCPDGSTIRPRSVCRAGRLAPVSARFHQAPESCRVSRGRFAKNTTRRGKRSLGRHGFRRSKGTTSDL